LISCSAPWEKARDDVIAYLEFSHAVTDAFHKSSTVRHGDTAIRHTIGRAHDSIVMEVERTCMQSHPDRSRPGCSRMGQFDMFNPVKAAWRSDDDGLHVGLQFKRLRGNRHSDRWNCRPALRTAAATFHSANVKGGQWQDSTLEAIEKPRLPPAAPVRRWHYLMGFQMAPSHGVSDGALHGVRFSVGLG
jgi:hypothetical protein